MLDCLQCCSVHSVNRQVGDAEIQHVFSSILWPREEGVHLVIHIKGVAFKHVGQEEIVRFFLSYCNPMLNFCFCLLCRQEQDISEYPPRCCVQQDSADGGVAEDVCSPSFHHPSGTCQESSTWPSFMDLSLRLDLGCLACLFGLGTPQNSSCNSEACVCHGASSTTGQQGKTKHIAWGVGLI